MLTAYYTVVAQLTEQKEGRKMSHFTVLVSVEPPKSTFSATIYTPKEMAELTALRALKEPGYQAKMRLRELDEKSSPFEQKIEDIVSDILDPFYENTEESEYLEFVETGTSYRIQYETGSVLQIRMPDGTLCFEHDDSFSRNYRLHEGKVYRHVKDESKLLALPDSHNTAPAGVLVDGFEVIEHYPLKDLYPTFTQFMEKYCAELYHKEKDAYGYYQNPNAKWDWWQLGGRWQHVFLVPEDCDLVVYGDSGTFGPQEANTPSGYRWVAGARKSDIQWDKMREWHLQFHQTTFQSLEKWFWEDVKLENHSTMLVKTEDGIHEWDNLIYKKGDTLDDYIRRMGINPEIRFPCTPFAFVDADGWHESGEMGWFGCSSNKKDTVLWHEEVDAFINRVPDNYFLVSVDCHI